MVVVALGFYVPTTTLVRSYGDGTSVLNLIRKAGEATTPCLQGEWLNHYATGVKDSKR